MYPLQVKGQPANIYSTPTMFKTVLILTEDGRMQINKSKALFVQWQERNSGSKKKKKHLGPHPKSNEIRTCILTLPM